MPSKILLADDSMTAQKMGKEILTGGGYEVTAVSNGAAAAKKLAEQFAVIILDINMPGYTGFELCEKVRANMASAKTPVLLTIGKMEHYEPTEVQRVKADGVIIKPFEATDLLATVQKMIEKAAPAEPSYEKTLIMNRPKVEDFKDDSYNQWKEEAPDLEPPPKAAIEMSHEVASAPAFGMDMEEHMETPAPSAPAAPAMEAAAPAFAMPTTPLTPVESSNIESLLQAPPAPPLPMEEAPRGIPVAPPTFSVPTPSAPSVSGRDPMFEAPEKSDDVAIPAKDPALASRLEMTNEEFLAKTAKEPTPPESKADPDAEFEARVAAAMSTGYEEAHEVVEPEPEEIHPEPVEEAHEAAPVIEKTPEPAGRVTMPGMMAEPPEYERTIKIERPADLEISGQFASAAEEVEIAPDPMIERLSDRETTPAPTMEVTSAPAPTVEPALEPTAEPEIEHHDDAALVEQMQAAVAEMPVEAHVDEPVPAPTMIAEVAPPPPAPAAAGKQDLELANALAAAVGAEAPSAMSAAAGSASRNTTIVDHNEIAAAVHRAMTKMMPAIMTEVAKELDPEKK